MRLALRFVLPFGLLTLVSHCSFWNAPSAVKELLHGLAAVDLACLTLSITPAFSKAPLLDGLSFRKWLMQNLSTCQLNDQLTSKAFVFVILGPTVLALSIAALYGIVIIPQLHQISPLEESTSLKVVRAVASALHLPSLTSLATSATSAQASVRSASVATTAVFVLLVSILGLQASTWWKPKGQASSWLKKKQ